METIACNFCGNPGSYEVYTIPDYLLNRPQVTARLVQCRKCGLIYQNPRPTLEEMAQHYPPEYDSYSLEGSSEGSWFARQGAAYGMRKRVKFVTRELSEGRLLDIGCATGVFLREMDRQTGWQVEGLEINEFAAAIAREKFQLEVFQGTLEEAAYPARHFEAVTMWDVLEHVHDPAATLAEIRRILKPGGVLVVRVPNYASLDRRLFGRYWAGLDAPRHLFVFDPPILTKWLGANGFGVRGRTSRIGSYPTFVLSVRFWLVAQAKSPRIRNRILGILNHPIARLISIPLFFLTSLRLRGPLLVVTAVKERNGLD
jgi:SAM-dependent methyltransferase